MMRSIVGLLSFCVLMSVGSWAQIDPPTSTDGKDIMFFIDHITPTDQAKVVTEVYKAIHSLNLDYGEASGLEGKVRAAVAVSSASGGGSGGHISIKHLKNFFPTTSDTPTQSDNLAHALQAAHQAVFSSENGDRPEVPNVLVLLSDAGRIMSAQSELQAIHNQGDTEVIVMSMGSLLDMTILETIVVDPLKDAFVASYSCQVSNFLRLRLASQEECGCIQLSLALPSTTPHPPFSSTPHPPF